MPPHHFESEVESFLEGSHGDRIHIKRADHHTVTPLCGTLLCRARVQVIGPACVFAGVHVTELPHEDFLCRGGGGHAGSDGSWAHLLAVLTLQCEAKPT